MADAMGPGSTQTESSKLQIETSNIPHKGSAGAFGVGSRLSTYCSIKGRDVVIIDGVCQEICAGCGPARRL